MKEQITITHIKWIARGYWERYFNWRIYPKSKLPLLLSAILFITLIAVAILTPTPADVPVDVEQSSTVAYSPAMATIVIVLAVLTVAALAIGLVRYYQNKDDFINSIATQWEQGDTQLPNTETVIKYLKDNKILE